MSVNWGETTAVGGLKREIKPLLSKMFNLKQEQHLLHGRVDLWHEFDVGQNQVNTQGNPEPGQ